MKKILKGAILLLPLVMGIGCKKSFLEIPPQSNANVDNFFKTSSDFNTALIGDYANLQKYFTSLIEMVGYKSDELDQPSPTSGAQDRYDIDKFQDQPANGITRDAWSMFYNGVERSNEILSNITGANFADSLKNRYTAEAKFLRTLNYYYLVQFWGKVPLVLQPITAQNSLAIGRSEVADVYKSMEQDLLAAIPALPAIYGAADLGRATSGAASTLLAKIYLLEKNYSSAAPLLSQIISGPYQLQKTDSITFSIANPMNAEVIFAVRYNSSVTGMGHSLWFSTSDTGSATGLNPKLVNSYGANDARKKLLKFTKQGNTYGLNKFYDVLNTTTKNAGNDYILFRLADVYLMQAEVLNEAGYAADSNTVAFKSLNKIRNRSGLTSYSAVDLPDQSSFRSAVLNERKWELALEGHRWLDLVRTGTTAASELQYEGLTIQGYQLLFPVPSSEIQKYNNPAIFGQNPGYAQ